MKSFRMKLVREANAGHDTVSLCFVSDIVGCIEAALPSDHLRTRKIVKY